MNPQAALDAPRWRWTEGRTVELEHAVPAHIADALARRGHDVRWALDAGGFGPRPDHLADAGRRPGRATEPRTDGQVAAG